MKVIHISPTYFDSSSIIGGGERYPTELASWMAKVVDSTLVSFSASRRTYRQGNLKIELYPVKKFIYGEILNPLSFRYISAIVGADIVHIHCVNALVSDLGSLAGFMLRKRVFVTDYGGRASLVLNRKLPVFKCYRNAIAYSQFGLEYLPPPLQKKAVLIKGGIDTEKFCPEASLQKENKILYIGRILPHKGINYLIEAFRLLNRPDYKLTIVGKVYSDRFYEDLKQLAENLPVEFVHDADDLRLLHEYRTARVTVLPSVHTTCYGDHYIAPELMGITLLESQACGTPAICTDAGAMPEFVEDGRTGAVVKQNSGEALASAISKIISLSPSEYAEYQDCCRQWIKALNWSTVVQKYIEIYSS